MADAAAATIRLALIIHRGRTAPVTAGGGGSTPASGSLTSLAKSTVRPLMMLITSPPTRRAKSTRKGSAGRSPLARELSVGTKPTTSAWNTPRRTPPIIALGMLTSPAKTVAASAATRRVKKSLADICANSGAMSTPARLATRLDSIHETIETRSPLMPCSCTRRGLSTTARICSPRAEKRKSTTRPISTTAVQTIVEISAALTAMVEPFDGRIRSLTRSTGHRGGGRYCGLSPNPKIRLTIWGMATSRPSDVTSLASAGAVRRCR